MVKMKLCCAAIMLITSIAGCKMKKVLPDATQEGLNTFGVKIDGKVWLPKGSFDILGGGKMRSGYDKQFGHLGITAQKATNQEVLQLVILNVKSVGSYSFNSDITSASATEYNGKLVDDNYVLYSGGTNKVNITKLDTINKIVSGTFEVQLQGKKKQKIKNFSQGIFDVKYEN